MTNQYFKPGEHIRLTYDRAVPRRTEMILPVTVVEDSPRRAMLYAAAGTRMQTLALEDGSPVPRDIPYAQLAVLNRIPVTGTWNRTNVLILWEPAWFWDVRLMWDASTGDFDCWYLNVQDPLRRSRQGFASTDHFIDIVIRPDGVWSLKDEAEFADAGALGMYSDFEFERIRQSVELAVEFVQKDGWPFSSDLQNFRPDPNWTIPRMYS